MGVERELPIRASNSRHLQILGYSSSIAVEFKLMFRLTTIKASVSGLQTCSRRASALAKKGQRSMRPDDSVCGRSQIAAIIILFVWVSGLGKQSASGHNHYPQLQQKLLWPVVGICRCWTLHSNATKSTKTNPPQQREGACTLPVGSITAAPTGAWEVCECAT